MRHLPALIASAGLLFCSIFPGTSLAQGTQTRIEEIIVTGEKREMSLQDVPVSITAFDSENLMKSNVNSLVDLNALAPGLTITKSEGYNRVPSIRGLGWEMNQNDQSIPSVAYHIDGVFIPEPKALNVDFLDVERIEVYRGPQGTVFGQNSTGGTINVISRQPVLGEFSGNVNFAAGDHDLLQPQGVINVPLGDTLALRGAVAWLKHDGFSEIVGTPIAGYDLDEEDNITGRVMLLWKPLDNFSATFSAEWYDTSVHDRAQKNILDPTPDPRDLRQSDPGIFDIENQRYALTLAWDVPWATVKSITSYQYMENVSRIDNDRATLAEVPFFQTIITDNSRQPEAVTQEINITSSPEGRLAGRLDWLVGGFYMYFEKPASFHEIFDFNQDGIFDPATETSFQADILENTRESWSIYGQGTYHISDTLRFTGGVRYTEDENTFEVCVFSFFICFETNPSSSEVTGKFDLQWDFVPEAMAYFSWTRGFKPGGANLGAFAQVVDLTFDIEEVLAYEIGVKTRMYDDRLQVNLAGFYYDYENLQFQAEDPVPFQGGGDNIPESEILGFEIEATALVTDRLRLDGNFGYLDTEITADFFTLDVAELIGIFDPVVRATFARNVKSNPLPKTPEFQGGVSATYTWPIQNLGVLTSGVQYIYRDEFSHRVFNSAALDIVPSYDLINLNFTFEPEAFDNWWLQFLITNVEDDDVVVSRFTNVFGVNSTSEEYASPRQFIVRVGYEF
jgi:iron complex outermembrane receptor protein